MSGVADIEEALDNFHECRGVAITVEQVPEQQLLTPADGSVGGCWTWLPEEEIRREKADKWRGCIYQVPTRIRDQNQSSYSPQVVSFGPFHHRDEQLQPMLHHKRRVLVHFLHRARKPIQDFIEAMNEVAEKLESMYHDLPVQNRERFVEMMIMDGSFMLEVVRTAIRNGHDYDDDDPIFGWHGHVYTLPYVRRDMLLIENQLPLLVLEKLVAVESNKQPPGECGPVHKISELVLKFLSPSTKWSENQEPLRHPIDVFRHSRIRHELEPFQRRAYDDDRIDVFRQERDLQLSPTNDISATVIHDAGIHLRKLNNKNVNDIKFVERTLSLPILTVNELTESIFTNQIAFEQLHVPLGASRTSFPVTAYVFFLSHIITSAEDVSLLVSRGIIRNALGNEHKVVELFMNLSNDLHVYPQNSPLMEVHRRMGKHCQKKWSIWRAHIARTYFRSPWAPISLAGSAFFLLITVLRNIYSLTQHREMVD